MKQEEPILVVISCLAYNQEAYIRDCLEGFVMQKTNFRFVAIVHDDCSTDKTAAIIREYEKKYPDIIKPIYEIENQWSKHDDSLGRIMRNAIEGTGAKYIAICEGDDYWTDPLKLQKQLDFLESHPDFSICFHRVKCLMMTTGEMVDEYIVKDMPGESTVVDLAKGNYIHTPSMMYRFNPDVNAKIMSFGFCMPGDYVAWMLYADQGKIWKIEEPMAVYRVGSGVWSTSQSFRSELSVLITISKIQDAITNQKAKEALGECIAKMADGIVEYREKTDAQLAQIQKSMAYRLGKALLKPFRLFKRNKNI